MRKFDRYDAAAIRRGVHEFLKDGTLTVEAGERKNAAGVLTFNSAKWPEDADLWHTYSITDVVEGVEDGFTFDLYIYEHPDDGGDILTNLDARWNGTAWEVFDPFSVAPAAVHIPKRKAVAR